MDMGTSSGPILTPNRVLLELRKARQWGRPRLARELHNFCLSRRIPSPGESNIAKQIYRLETGRVRSPDEFYTRIYCEFFGRSKHDLFGDLRSGEDQRMSTYSIRSHKFIPIYVGPESARRLIDEHPHFETTSQWTDCLRSRAADHPLYAWPCGVVTFHICEDIAPTCVAEIAAWRQETYPKNLEWAAALLDELGCTARSEPYVLSAYWVDSVPVPDLHFHTALRLLAMPRVLTDRAERAAADDGPDQAHARLVEQALLRDGFDHPGIEDFGIKGISAAYASWSGVVYHASAPRRALTEDELIACELSVQAAWAYSDFIRQEVEHGRDPIVPDEYGWRYLRGLQSRLTTERPQETSQHRAMREAVVNTSGLKNRLGQALVTLKECAGQ
ncbi:MAG: hypothetical protein AB7L91_18555 [Dehalococcoidia bacterium]